MYTFEFESMGTAWAVLVDSDQFSPHLEKDILSRTHEYEQAFSRFIEGNEATRFRTANAGTYPVSPTLRELLEFAQEMRLKSQGVFDPAIGTLLELAGYDQQYSFQTSVGISEWEVPAWQLKDDQIKIDNPVIFDIGGYGKGYWIDTIARMLKAAGYQHFLIDGGGDLFGTDKKTGEGWSIAIEYPGKKEYAISQVTLKHQALANSDIFKRQWGEWNHVIEPIKRSSAKDIVGCSVIAKQAMIADGLTTVLMLKPQIRESIAEAYSAEYLILTRAEQVLKSKDWSGEVYA